MRRALVAIVALVALVAIVAIVAITGRDQGAGTGGARAKRSPVDVDTFCKQSAADESIFSAAGPGATDSSAALAAFEDLTNIAPAEIAADMTTILNFLKSSSSDAPDSSAAASVTAASQRVVQFFKDKCHVDLAGSSASTSFGSVASSISN